MQSRQSASRNPVWFLITKNWRKIGILYIKSQFSRCAAESRIVVDELPPFLIFIIVIVMFLSSWEVDWLLGVLASLTFCFVFVFVLGSEESRFTLHLFLDLCSRLIIFLRFIWGSYDINSIFIERWVLYGVTITYPNMVHVKPTQS